MSIDQPLYKVYNIIKIKVRQTNTPKRCEAENHIPVSRPRVGNSQEDESTGTLKPSSRL